MKKPLTVIGFFCVLLAISLSYLNFSVMKRHPAVIETSQSYILLPIIKLISTSPPAIEYVPMKKYRGEEFFIFFDSDKYNIRPDAEPTLEEVAEFLKKNPNVTVVIEGYADIRGIPAYNLRLAQRRADATKAALVRLGVDPSRVTTASGGETEQFAAGTTEDAYQLNRIASFNLVIPILPTPMPTPAPPPMADISKIVEDELKKLAPGKILFNPPEVMKVGVKERVEVRISKTITEDLTKGLRGRGVAQIEGIRVGTFMKVRLTGDNFNIKVLSHEEQLVSGEGFTQWDFDVVPLKSGIQSLLLTVTVRIKIPNYGEERKDYPVFERKITVEVNPIYSITNFIEKNWQWIITTVIGLIIAFGIIQRIIKRIVK